MIVTLTGFMGSGKSTTGRALAGLLDCEFIDLDRYIEKKIGRTIPQIFEEDGEMKFRAMEAEALRDVVIMHQLTGKDLILSLGGGTIMTTSVQHLIFEDTICVYLKASEQTLRSRIGSGKNRPLADENFTERLASRIPTYEKAAITVVTDGKTHDELASEIRLELINIDAQ